MLVMITCGVILSPHVISGDKTNGTLSYIKTIITKRRLPTLRSLDTRASWSCWLVELVGSIDLLRSTLAL